MSFVTARLKPRPFRINQSALRGAKAALYLNNPALALA
jgi:hypothetical protein